MAHNRYEEYERKGVKAVKNLIYTDNTFNFSKEKPEFHPYDVTITSGNSSTILLTEVKLRNVPFGYYPSTIIEGFKYSNILQETNRFRREYGHSNFTFIPSLLTFYTDGVTTLHLLEDHHYTTQMMAEHRTVEQSDEVEKQFINYNINNYVKKWDAKRRNRT